MSSYSLTHLADSKLSQDLRTGVGEDRATLALRLAQIAEFDRRRLYLPAYPSMYQFCLNELKYSEDEACRRICVAREAQRFPQILAAIADGRLSLTTVCMLATHLLPETAQELLDAAAGSTKDQVAHLLARRFPKPDLPTIVEPLVVSTPVTPASPVLSPSSGDVFVRGSELSAPARVDRTEPAPARTDSLELSAPARISPIESAPIPQVVVPVAARPRVMPLSPERYGIQLTVSKTTRDKLFYARDLLSHAIPSGDLEQVLERALDALIPALERSKFAATDKPRPRSGASSKDPRHIPAHVKRAVWNRDGGCCTHVDEQGHRCAERKFLEYDHEEPVARGGEATVKRVRLRCRAHNQHAAERVFGAAFMENKRRLGRERSARGRGTRTGDASGAGPRAISRA